MPERDATGSRRWSTKPAGLSLKRLAEVPDDQLVERVIKYTGRILRRDLCGDLARGYARFKAGYLPQGFVTVWVTAEVDYQVANGGFGQFFWNQSRHIADVAAGSLRTIGARRYAVIVGDAVAIYEGHRRRLDALRTANERDAYYKQTGEIFDGADRAFYHRWNANPGEIATLQVIWIRKNPDAFQFDD